MKQLHWEKIVSAGKDTLWSQPVGDAPNGGLASALGVNEKVWSGRAPSRYSAENSRHRREELPA